MKYSKPVLSFGAVALVLGTTIVVAGAVHPPRTANAGGGGGVEFDFARIYWEYNATADDLGVHVTLDGEDWTELEIENPDEDVIFGVQGKGPYQEFGMTELFFEGAEPSLDDVPLDVLLAKFPEGRYEFSGLTADGHEIESTDRFTHAIPDGPTVFADLGANDFLRIRWTEVDSPPPGFPNRRIDIVAYQVIVEDFQVTVPPDVFAMTVPPEYVATLEPGEHQFEVLAIEKSANQTLSEGYFDL